MLRAVETLTGDALLTVTARDPRTQRTRYEASATGSAVLTALAA